MQNIEHGERIFAGFLQQLRNVIITSSMSIALLSFNKTTINKRGILSRYIVRGLALAIILYSIFYGLSSIKNFKKNMKAIDVMSNNNQYAKDKIEFLHRWNDEILFFYIYLFILIALVVAIYIIPLLRILF